MSKDNTKSSSDGSFEKINEMILKFRQCADTASELSNSVEKFTDIYINIEKNVTELKEVEENLNSNEYIKDLLHVTNNMKDIFNYFNSSIPELSESMQASKKQLDLYKDELEFAADYFKNLPDEIENKIKKIDNQHSKTRKKVVEDIKKDINTQFVDFEKEILKSINDTVDRVVSEKIQFMFNEFDNITNGAIEAINRNDYLYAVDTIYNLYVNNGRSLPLYVRRKTWTGNFYFRVDTIERDDGHNFGLTAYGVRFKDDIFYDSFQISADLKQFEIQPMEFVSNIDITPIDDGDIPF